MPRPSNWNSPTEAVRLPKHAIEACLKLAAALDTPLPQAQTDPALAEQQQRHLRFVQNFCGKPTMVTIADGLDEKQYVIRPDVPTIEDYQAIEQAIEKLMERMKEEKFNEHKRMYLFSKLVEQVCKPIGGDRHD